VVDIETLLFIDYLCEISLKEEFLRSIRDIFLIKNDEKGQTMRFCFFVLYFRIIRIWLQNK